MKKQLLAMLVVAILAITGGNAFALEVAYTFSGNGDADGDVYETTLWTHEMYTGDSTGGWAIPDRNFGSGAHWGGNELISDNPIYAPPVGASAGENTRALIRFDVSDLAGLAYPVVSIELRAYQLEGVASQIGFHVISDENSNWEEGFDTGSGGTVGWWNRTTWNSKLQGTADSAWYRFDFGWEQYGLVGGFDETPIASGTTTGSGWQSVSFTGSSSYLTDLIADWSQSPVFERVTGRFTDPQEFEVADNPGMLFISNDGIVKFSSSEGMVNPDGYTDGSLVNPDGYPDGELIDPDGYPDGESIDPDGIPDNGDEFIAPYDSFTAPYDSFTAPNDSFYASPELIVTVLEPDPPAPGDFDGNDDINADDIDLMGEHIRTSVAPNAANYDLTADGLTEGTDGVVDILDLDYLVRALVDLTTGGNGTEYADFNLDGLVDTTDLTRLASYFGPNSLWSEGNANPNIDLMIDTTDLTILGTYFGFDASVDVIPEPMTLFVMGCGAIGLLRRRRS